MKSVTDREPANAPESPILRRPLSPGVVPSFLIFSSLLFISLLLRGPRLSPDSVNTWEQALGEIPFSNHHPWPYTLVVRFLSNLHEGPWLWAVAQVLCMSLALALFTRALSGSWGMGPWPFVAAVVLCLPIPPIGPLDVAYVGLGAFTVNLWKDVALTAAAIWLASALLQLAAPGSVRKPTRSVWIQLAMASLAVGLLRWNGAALALVALVLCLPAAGPGRRLKVLAAGAVPAAMGFLAVALAPVATGIQPMEPRHSSANQISDLAWVASHHPSHLPPSVSTLMSEIAPLADWSAAGSQVCHSVDPVVYDLADSAPGRADRMNTLTPRFTESWIEWLRNHPFEGVEVRLCRLFPFGSAEIPPIPQAAFALGLFLTTGGLALAYAATRRVSTALASQCVAIASLATYALLPYSVDVRYYFLALVIPLITIPGFFAGILAQRQASRSSTGRWPPASTEGARGLQTAEHVLPDSPD